MKRLIAALVISSVALAETFISLPQSLGPAASPEFRNLNIESNGTNQSTFTIDNTGCTQYGINGEHFVLNYYNVNDKTVLGGPGIHMDGRGTLFSINGIYGTAHHAGNESTSNYRLIPPFWHTGGAVDVGDWSAAMIGCSTDTRKGLVIEAGKHVTIPGSVALAIGYNDSATDTSHCTVAIGPSGIIGFGDVIPTSSNDLDEVEEIFPVLITPSSTGLSLTGTLAVSGATTLTGGVRLKEGANLRAGVSTLSGGAVVVANTSVTATSRILLSIQSLGTVSVPKAIGVTARTAGTSFTITSADATDTSVIYWELKEPAP